MTSAAPRAPCRNSRRRLRSATSARLLERKKYRDTVDTAKNRDYVSPSRHFLRKQVSKTITTTRRPDSTSTRTVKTVDEGSLSPAKWLRADDAMIPRIQPGPPSTDRVFVCQAFAEPSSSSAGAHFFWSSACSLRRAAPDPFRRALHAGGWSRVRPRHCLVLGRTPRYTTDEEPSHGR